MTDADVHNLRIGALKQQLADHFKNELRIMRLLLTQGYTKAELIEIEDFIATHEYSKLIDKLSNRN
ncbi:MAG TPA: hypothetical protein VI338_01350 [Nitrososphaera sp.]|nr:hypothetical protein [Nitrososphaera sp.]